MVAYLKLFCGFLHLVRGYSIWVDLEGEAVVGSAKLTLLGHLLHTQSHVEVTCAEARLHRIQERRHSQCQSIALSHSLKEIDQKMKFIRSSKLRTQVQKRFGTQKEYLFELPWLNRHRMRGILGSAPGGPLVPAK